MINLLCVWSLVSTSLDCPLSVFCPVDTPASLSDKRIEPAEIPLFFILEVKDRFDGMNLCSQIEMRGYFGLNKVYSLDIVVHLKQNTISYTTSQTAYMSTAVTLNTQNYRHKFWKQQDERWEDILMMMMMMMMIMIMMMMMISPTLSKQPSSYQGENWIPPITSESLFYCRLHRTLYVG